MTIKFRLSAHRYYQKYYDIVNQRGDSFKRDITLPELYLSLPFDTSFNIYLEDNDNDAIPVKTAKFDIILTIKNANGIRPINKTGIKAASGINTVEKNIIFSKSCVINHELLN